MAACMTLVADSDENEIISGVKTIASVANMAAVWLMVRLAMP